MRLLVLYNPAAARTPADRGQLLDLLRAHGHDPVCCNTADRDWQAALDDGAIELLVAAGGDGTVATLARAAALRRLPLAILPLGVANNISRALGLGDFTIDELVDSWRDAERSPFDLGIARGPWGVDYFLESVGIGLLTALMAAIDDAGEGSVNAIESPEERLHAARRVGHAVLERLHPMDLALTIDGRRTEGRFLLVEVLNFGAAGPNLELTPAGHHADGLLEVALAEDTARARLAERLARPEGAAPLLRVHPASRVTLHCGPCELHLDDRRRAADGDVELGIAPGALSFLVPRRHRAA